MEDKRQRKEARSSIWVWSWGAGTHGQLASADFIDHWEPLLLPSFGEEIDGSSNACSKILDMAGGGAHAVAVLGHGRVVTWGNGYAGALGHGDELDLSVPKVLTYFQGISVCSVAAGWNHTAFVTDSGELYTCGNGTFGQLGHGNFEACFVPRKVEALRSYAVSMVACGMRHTLVLTQGSAVYGFGSSKRGQLGIGTPCGLGINHQLIKNSGKISVPQWVRALRELEIVTLEANGDHSAALSKTGLLYVWGRGFMSGSDILHPVHIGCQLRFSQVTLGWNHCIGLADGEIWALGSNDRGQLGILKGFGTSTVTDTGKDSKPGPTAASLGAHSFVGDAQGELTEIFKVGGLDRSKVVWVSAGAEHSTVVLDDGRIMIWGWGEHGQLGLGRADDQLFPALVQIPGGPLEGKLTWRTFCGSGFTFAVAECVTEA